jgi:hypothetical protein
MPRTPAPKKYRTELPISQINESSQFVDFVEAVRAVAKTVLVIEFEGMDLWEIHNTCSKIESTYDVVIEKPYEVK